MSSREVPDNPHLSQGLELLRKRLTTPNIGEAEQIAMTRCAGLQITARLAADLGGAEPPRGTGALCWPLICRAGNSPAAQYLRSVGLHGGRPS